MSILMIDNFSMANLKEKCLDYIIEDYIVNSFYKHEDNIYHLDSISKYAALHLYTDFKSSELSEILVKNFQYDLVVIILTRGTNLTYLNSILPKLKYLSAIVIACDMENVDKKLNAYKKLFSGRNRIIATMTTDIDSHVGVYKLGPEVAANSKLLLDPTLGFSSSFPYPRVYDDSYANNRNHSLFLSFVDPRITGKNRKRYYDYLCSNINQYSDYSKFIFEVTDIDDVDFAYDLLDYYETNYPREHGIIEIKIMDPADGNYGVIDTLDRMLNSGMVLTNNPIIASLATSYSLPKHLLLTSSEMEYLNNTINNKYVSSKDVKDRWVEELKYWISKSKLYDEK